MTDRISLSDQGPDPSVVPERLVLDRVGGSYDVERRLDGVTVRPSRGAVDPEVFAEVLATEFDRLQHGGTDSLVAVISLAEIAGIRGRLGDGYVFDLVTEVTKVASGVLSADDLYNVSEDGEVVVLARDRRVGDATKRIRSLCAEIAARRFGTPDEHVQLTPFAGVAALSWGSSPADVLRRAQNARYAAIAGLERRVERPTTTMLTRPGGISDVLLPPVSRSIGRWLKAPTQILAMFALGLVVSILVYLRFDLTVGFDLSDGIYLVLAGTLALTAATILKELVSSRRQRRHRPAAVDPHRPSASAVDPWHVVARVAPHPRPADRLIGRDPGDGPPVVSRSATGTVWVDAATSDVPASHQEQGVDPIVRKPTISDLREALKVGQQIVPGERCSAEQPLPQRRPGASLTEPKRPVAISEHARLSLRPGQYGGILDRSPPDPFAPEFDRMPRASLAALEGMRRAPVAKSA